MQYPPKKGARVIVAMSGGVDSSVSAGILKRLGYDVIGISLHLHDYSESAENEFGTCCSLGDVTDARRVAAKLEIPFYVKNMENQFQKSVIDDFVSEYLKGRTPNPCVRCNEKVKFTALLDWALDLGADHLATGHYANIGFNPNTHEYELLKGRDLEKDQSYFLFPLTQEELKHCIFPVGDLTKPEVRQLAQEMELSVSTKPDSQEICFVQGQSYRDFIEERVTAENLKAGNIVDLDGNIVGNHPGIHHFTLGQRKGIGALGLEPSFVIELRPETNEVVVGPEQHLMMSHASVTDVNWINSPKGATLEAKVRYRAKPTEITLETDGKKAQVRFKSPQRAITPGQAMVFYDKNRVVGGGWIDQVGR